VNMDVKTVVTGQVEKGSVKDRKSQRRCHAAAAGSHSNTAR
jgi:hypothetical protein